MEKNLSELVREFEELEGLAAVKIDEFREGKLSQEEAASHLDKLDQKQQEIVSLSITKVVRLGKKFKQAKQSKAIRELGFEEGV